MAHHEADHADRTAALTAVAVHVDADALAHEALQELHRLLDVALLGREEVGRGQVQVLDAAAVPATAPRGPSKAYGPWPHEAVGELHLPGLVQRHHGAHTQRLQLLEVAHRAGQTSTSRRLKLLPRIKLWLY